MHMRALSQATAAVATAAAAAPSRQSALLVDASPLVHRCFLESKKRTTEDVKAIVAKWLRATVSRRRPTWCVLALAPLAWARAGARLDPANGSTTHLLMSLHRRAFYGF